MPNTWQQQQIGTEVERIRALDVTQPGTTFSSQQGPCRYSVGENAAIRDAKHAKIQESIQQDRR